MWKTGTIKIKGYAMSPKTFAVVFVNHLAKFNPLDFVSLAHESFLASL